MADIRPIDVRTAPEADCAALNRFRNRMHAELEPDDPPTPLDVLLTTFRNLPDFLFFDLWLAWAPGEHEVIAEGSLQGFHEGDNAHLGQMNIRVLPEHRRQGLGRRLLAELVGAAGARGRRALVAPTSDRIPAGEAFMTRIGAVQGLATHTNQLAIADVDPALLRRWQDQAAEQASGFELGLWDGPFPENQIEAVARLYDVMNDAPIGDLEVADIHLTPEQLRQMERPLFDAGTQRWIIYARERSSGRLAGFTEVWWHPNRPKRLSQGNTGVFPEYRGHKLGRWLKAAMLDKVILERPSVQYIRTGNADSNAAMLKINVELGFNPYSAEAFWQVATEQARAYLDQASGQS